MENPWQIYASVGPDQDMGPTFFWSHGSWQGLLVAVSPQPSHFNSEPKLSTASIDQLFYMISLVLCVEAPRNIKLYSNYRLVRPDPDPITLAKALSQVEIISGSQPGATRTIRKCT